MRNRKVCYIMRITNHFNNKVLKHADTNHFNNFSSKKKIILITIKIVILHLSKKICYPTLK